ncbi:MAG: VCBS repeat-containing protein, partial [Planctomycetes bacterium]|nr:VCBS repeat-containing protein [Planctomycetota bacterium]
MLWRVEGVGGLIGRGADLHRLGDFNNDGWDDLLERGVASLGSSLVMAVRVVSGRDGSILSSGMPLPHQYWSFGNMALLGDMDGDGRPDYGAHAYDALIPWSTQTLVAVSSAQHQILWSATIPNAWGTDFGKVLCGDLDVDGDGRNDVVTSAFSLSPWGTIIVYDNSGSERYRLVDPIPGIKVGLDVASLQGDLDNDGCGDFVSTGLESQGRGAVVCFSGRTGAVLQVSYGEQPNDALVNAGACGDIDGDGALDYCGGGSFHAGVVTAFSGATGQIIHSWRDPQNCCMGINVTGGQDLDSDGVPDLITGQTSISQPPYDRIVSAL